MIVGRGLLASAFAPAFEGSSDWVIFASGVSNSGGNDPEEFLREELLLGSWLKKAHTPLVYFSSCGLVNGDTVDTPYMCHKRRMESLVMTMEGAVILRLPQVVGATHNPHTLMNYLRNKIVSGEHFDVWQYAERNIIDVDDVAAIAEELLRAMPADERVVNIAAEKSSPMTDIVHALEEVLGKQGNYSLVPKGNAMPLDSRVASAAARRLGIDLGGGYLRRTIAKYYVASTVVENARYVR